MNHYGSIKQSFKELQLGNISVSLYASRNARAGAGIGIDAYRRFRGLGLGEDVCLKEDCKQSPDANYNTTNPWSKIGRCLKFINFCTKGLAGLKPANEDVYI